MNIRLMEIEEPKFPYKFSASHDAYNAVKDYGRADRECFLVLFLNAANILIDCEPISVGCVDAAAVYRREVIRSALLHNASAIIIAHNHPSNDLTPSQADMDITRNIIAACMTVQIQFLDHIILGRDSYFSMADAGDLNPMTERVEGVLDKLEGRWPESG